MNSDHSALKLNIKGTVQGVGFRPFVYRLALENHLTGWVNNTSAGVVIEINGKGQDISTFVYDLTHSLPPLAKIEKITSEHISPKYYSNFTIIESLAIPGEFFPVPADSTICPDCLRELFDPANRRFRYPFINCTNCGPRYTIIKNIPYDRPNTTMAEFELCPDCKKEYLDPLDRRYHAQPVACSVCGPFIWAEANGEQVSGNHAIRNIRNLVSQGKICAIKGLGGFHLACDASSEDAVQNLRRRKKRFDKPLAVMVFNTEIADSLFYLTDVERSILNSTQRPIVLLEPRPDSNLAYSVTQGLNRCGVMLPYTPLHYLLLEPEEGIPNIWIMTSGNISDEPIARTNEDASRMLSGIADSFLFHNRDIHARIDDSVVFYTQHTLHFMRRARGYAPEAIRLHFDANGIFAAGASIKNSFCIGREDFAFLSPHIGDLENLDTYQAYLLAFQQFQNLFNLQVRSVCTDLHPDYLSTKFAQKYAEENNLNYSSAQHHHAHLASCLADNGLENGVDCVGVCLDGTGLGTDGTIWGGEFLYGSYTKFDRLLSLLPLPLPGGDAAARHPNRIALAYLIACGVDWDGLHVPSLASFTQSELDILKWQLAQSINVTLTSSMGRLFDAVSSIAGVTQHTTFEGQAAMRLESVVDLSISGEYPVEIDKEKVLIAPILQAIIQDISQKKSPEFVSTKFHRTVARMVVLGCERINKTTGAKYCALTGGVWQNKALLNLTVPELEKSGFTVLMHKRVPANDGGIALGQLAITASQMNS